MYGIAWLWWIGLLTGMYPWARWALAYPPHYKPDGLLLMLVTLAFSFGGVTLIAFGIGWAGIRIDWRGVTALYVAVCAIGWLVYGRMNGMGHDPSQPVPSLMWLNRIALVAIGIMVVLILFNALYWPIGADDALAIYAYMGKVIATSGSLPTLYPGATYAAYPMALPLSEALIFQSAGWFDTHLAALSPALLSVGTIGAAYLIGRALINRAVGSIAALLIALTPIVAYWGSTSYADLPAGFFYGMAWLFVIRYGRDRRLRDAMLGGIMAGLAAWTKNSALLIVGSLVVWIVWLHVLGHDLTNRPAAIRVIVRSILRDTLRIGLPFLIVCGGWYARAEIRAGWIVPPTNAAFAAQRTIGHLFPYLTDNRYLPTGILFTIGLLILLSWGVRSRGREFFPMTLLIAYLPFFAIWWALFSYENRFLLVLTPLIGVMGGWFVYAASRRLIRLRAVPVRWLNGLAAIALITALIPSALAAVLYKNDVIRQPFASERTKQMTRVGGRYDIGLYVQAQTIAPCVITTDTLLPYFAFPTNVIVSANLLNTSLDLQGCTMLMLTPGETLPAELRTWHVLTQAGGYSLYSISMPQA